MLKALAATALGGTSRMAGADEARLLRRRIPSSGESLAVIGLGTYRRFDVETDAVPALEPVLAAFVALGGELVDSSPMYGRAESVVGELARRLGVRDRLFLATKVWTSGRAEGIRQMETSLSRLGVQRLPLMQVHNLLDWRTQWLTLRDWQAAGRVRYLGVTHYHADAYRELEAVLRAERPDFVQLNYSLGEREAETRLLPLARDLGVAVIANRPFAQGALFERVRGKALPPWAMEFDCTSWAQFFLKFVLAHPAISCVIPATDQLSHLEDNLAAGRGRLPDAAQRARMIDVFARLAV